VCFRLDAAAFIVNSLYGPWSVFVTDSLSVSAVLDCNGVAKACSSVKHVV